MPRRRSATVERGADEAQALTVDQVLRAVNGRWGEDTMVMASDPRLEIERLPCGILSVDLALGGGFSRNRHTELYGQPHVGKTYLAQMLCAATQAEGGNAAWVDAESTFDPSYAASCGVDIDSLAYHRQKTGNQCIDFMETLLRSRLYDVIVLDSIAALLPKSELEQDMDAATMGTQQAKLMSVALRRLTTANHRTAIIYINQMRENIGVMFGQKYITSGGKAMGFYAGTRIELVRTENIKRKVKAVNMKSGADAQEERVKGHRVLVKIAKDKTGGAVTNSETTFVYDYDLGGADPIEDLLYLGRVTGLVHKRNNTWWVDDYEDEKQVSRGKLKGWLRRNVAVNEELAERIREAVAERADELVDA